MKRVHVHLSEPMLKVLKAEAKRYDLSLAETIRMWLRRGMGSVRDALPRDNPR